MSISLIGNVAGHGEVNPVPLLMKNVRDAGNFRRIARDVRNHEPRDQPVTKFIP